MAEPLQLWVRSAPAADGTFVVELSAGDDRAWVLNRDRAIAYAVTCVQRATEAEHDTAVFRLLLHRGVSLVHAADLIGSDLRGDRPLDHSATEPLRLTPGAGTRGPFVAVALEDQVLGQVTPEQCRDHGLAVLMALAAVDLDAALRRVLVGSVGLDDHSARVAVSDLAKHWPGSEQGS